MLEILNTISCVLLMVYGLPVAMIMGNRGMWGERFSIVAVQLGLFMQLTSPWIGWAPAITWPGVYLNVSAAVLITIWWRRLWAFVQHYVGPVDGPISRKRRWDDWHQTPSPAQHAHRVHRDTWLPKV